MKTYIDFTETTTTPGANHDFFVSASISILNNQIESFERCLSTAKIAIGLPPHAPVKWNLNDRSLTQWFASAGLIETLAITKQKSHLLRSTLINELLKLLPLPKIICCTLRWFNPDRKTRIAVWGFQNILQRLGLIQKAMQDSPHSLEIDWTGDDRKHFDNVWEQAYLNGISATCTKPFFSGPLQYLGFQRGPAYFTTLQNPNLQIIDILLGLLTTFVKDSLMNSSNSRVPPLVRKVMPLFYRDTSDILWGRGFIVNKDLRARIQEVHPWFN